MMLRMMAWRQSVQSRPSSSVQDEVDTKDPFHESAGLVWQAWRPGDRLGTITKAKATGTQAEKGKAPRPGGGCGNRPPVITGSY